MRLQISSQLIELVLLSLLTSMDLQHLIDSVWNHYCGW